MYSHASTCAPVGVNGMNHMILSYFATTNLVSQCGNRYLDLARDIRETANFATHFTGSPAAESTPHLYISALATWSRDTSLCRNWKKQFSRIPVYIHTKGSVDLPLMTIPAGNPINAVAFSSDGTQIVSGSDDKSVRVWDASTGVGVKVLKGHTGLVNSVAFSSDGTQIVSGSYDNSVRVWDASTGAEVKVLKGHTGSVYSVAFSGNGTQIVSGSDDNSVRVWDALTGAEVKVLKGHTSSVKSVAFSSDGTQIVSGSNDQSVRAYSLVTPIWNLANTNWIVSSQGTDHLMWVPPAAQVTEPSNILVISCHGSGFVDFQQSMIGVHWVGCYTPLSKV